MLKIVVISLICLIALGDTTPLSLSKTLKIMKKVIAKYLSFSTNRDSARKTINHQTNLTNIVDDKSQENTVDDIPSGSRVNNDRSEIPVDVFHSFENSSKAVPSIPPENIVDAYPINIADAPWQVALLSKEKGYRLFCGGSRITEFHVLTAANCLCYETGITMNKEDIVIASGSKDYTSATRNEVDEIKCHPDFASGVNDIAVMQVKNFLDLDSGNRYPIELNEESTESLAGQKAFVSGWRGINNHFTLQGTEQKILSNEDCNSRLRDRNQDPLKRGEVCLVSDNNRMICNFFAGGSAIFDSDSRTFLIGIVTKILPGTDGTPCGPEAITVVTDISSFFNFIDTTITTLLETRNAEVSYTN